MPNRMPLIDARMFATDFYPNTVTITTPTMTQSGSGAPTDTFNAVPAMTNLKCRFAPVNERGKEVKKPDGTYSVVYSTIVFKEKYAAITPKMQALIDGIEYDILEVVHDAEDMSTRLRVEYAI